MSVDVNREAELRQRVTALSFDVVALQRRVTALETLAGELLAEVQGVKRAKGGERDDQG